MADPSVTVKGGAELRRTLKRTHPEVDRQLQRDLRSIGARVALVGAARAPRLSGALQQSIRPVVTQRGVSIGSRLPYAGVVHWGGTIQPKGTPFHIRRNPFLVEAVADTAVWAEHQIAEGFDRAVTRAGWKPGPGGK